MTRKELEGPIKEMQEILADPEVSDSVKDAIRPSLAEAKRMLAALDQKKEPAKANKVARSVKEIVKAVAKAPKKTDKPTAAVSNRSLKEIVARTKELSKLYGSTSQSDLERDAKRKAKKPGSRTSGSGKTYREYRSDRTDINSKRPYLAKGGEISQSAYIHSEIKKEFPDAQWHADKHSYLFKMKPNRKDRWEKPESLEAFMNRKDLLISVGKGKVPAFDGSNWDDEGNIRLALNKNVSQPGSKMAKGGSVRSKSISTMSKSDATKYLKTVGREDLIKFLVAEDKDGEYTDVRAITSYGRPNTKEELKKSFWALWNEYHTMAKGGSIGVIGKEAELVDFDSMYDGTVKAYRDVEQDDLYFYVSDQGGSFVVVGEAKGYPASEAYDDWFKNKEDAMAITKMLAEGKDPDGDRYAKGGNVGNDQIRFYAYTSKHLSAAGIAAFTKAIKELSAEEDKESTYYDTATRSMRQLMETVDKLAQTTDTSEKNKLLQMIGIYNYKTGLLLDTSFLNNELAKGGRIKSATNRDRKYKSQQKHEQAYKRKTKPANPSYNVKNILKRLGKK